ncbi:MAG: hypothetical protein WAS27_03830 [Candidatus Saccharimonadales bacterium]
MKKAIYIVGAWVAGGVLAVTTLASALLTLPAHAVSSGGKMFISADNTFYAYVKGGETISASFIKTDQVELLGLEKQDIPVTLEGPELETQRCILEKAAATGSGCRFTNVTAPETGIYKITVALPAAAKPYESITPSVKWGGNLYSWDIAVHDSQTEKTGRIWSELYAVRQPIEVSYSADLTLHYVSENGYAYRAQYKGYNGQISTFSADAVGIVKRKECTSAYQSVQVDDTKYAPSFGECGGSFKVFFEQPAGDLPERAKTWDGTSSEWIAPTVVPPKVSELRFESDAASDLQSGIIKYKLSNFVGQYRVEIDTDGNGSFSGKDDIRISRTMKRTTNNTQTVKFSGVDAAGQVIPTTQPIAIRIHVEKVAEIHLVNADVEGRTGGLEIMRLNGENAPSSRICWNDTDLVSLASTSLQTSALDGRHCPESAGKALHGWAYATGSWGDNRYIDDWAYAAVKVKGITQIEYPEDNQEVAVSQQNHQWVLFAGIGVTIAALIGGATVLVVRRQRRVLQVKAAQQQAAMQIPGPSDPPLPPMNG